MTSNTERAEWAAEAVGIFMGATGSDEDSAAADLICDLLHLEQQEGRDPLQAIRNGLANYIAEVSDSHEDGMYAEAKVELDLQARPYSSGADWQPWDLEAAKRLRKESRQARKA